LLPYNCTAEEDDLCAAEASSAIGGTPVLPISSGATEAFTAVEAFVAGAVAHRDVPAVRARRRVELKVRDGIAQGCHAGSSISVALVAAIRHVQHIQSFGFAQ